MRGRNMILGFLMLIISSFIYRLFFLPELVFAFNTDNFILEQETATCLTPKTISE